MQTDYYYDYPNYSGKNPKQGYYFETYYIEYLLWALSEYLGKTEVKRCSKCGYECKLGVAGEYFYKHKNCKDGYRPDCKACRAEYCTQYHKDNKEYKAEYDKQRYDANREARKEQVKHWQQANSNKITTYRHKRRTKKLGNGGSYTVAEEQLLLQWQGAKCAYCQCDISNGYSRDHIQPISKDGNSYITNIALACKSCNSSKGNRVLWLWLSLDFAVNFFTNRKQFNLLIALNKNN